jgi:hypothetical protein
MRTTAMQWPHAIPWWKPRGIWAAHLRIRSQLDDSTLQSLRLVPSIHDASCEWSDTGKGCEVTCSTQNQLVTYCDNQGSTNVGSVQHSGQTLHARHRYPQHEAWSLYKILLLIVYNLYTEYYLLFGICGESKIGVHKHFLMLSNNFPLTGPDFLFILTQMSRGIRLINPGK